MKRDSRQTADGRRQGKIKGLESLVLAVLLSAFCLLHTADCFSAGPGTSTANFLKIGVGGRAAAMGEAQTAVVDDASATYWNPAALADLSMQEIMAMHDELFQSTRYEYFSYARPTQGWGTFAGSLSLVTVGDIQGYDTNGIKTQSYSASDVLGGGHWGNKHAFSRGGSLSYGVSAKLLRKKLGDDSAQGYMMDAGAIWRPHWDRLKNLRLGFVLQNVGPGVKFVSESSPFPRTAKFGLGYSFFGDNLVLATDILAPRDNNLSANLGMEYRILDVLALRAGYVGQHDIGTKVTFGVGIGNKTIHIDYAFEGYGDLGVTNKLSVGIRFGRSLRTTQMDEAIDERYRIAARHEAQGYYLGSYIELTELLEVAPWYKPAQELVDKMKEELKDVKDVEVQRLLEAEIARHLKVGRDALDRDDLVNARQEFQAILALQPNHQEAQQNLARVEERFASVIDTFFKAGLKAFEEGRYLEAKESFGRVLLLNPKHEQAKSEYDKVSVLLEEAEHAKQAKARAGMVQGYYAGGMAHLNAGEWEEAYLSFKSVLKLEPKHAEARARLDEVRNRMFEHYYQEGLSDYKRGMLVKAVENLNKALTFDPYSVTAKDALNKTQERLGHFKKTKSQSLYKQGLEAFEAGDKKTAQELWEKAVSLDPENMEAKRGLERLGK